MRTAIKDWGEPPEPKIKDQIIHELGMQVWNSMVITAASEANLEQRSMDGTELPIEVLKGFGPISGKWTLVVVRGERL